MVHRSDIQLVSSVANYNLTNVWNEVRSPRWEANYSILKHFIVHLGSRRGNIRMPRRLEIKSGAWQIMQSSYKNNNDSNNNDDDDSSHRLWREKIQRSDRRLDSRRGLRALPSCSRVAVSRCPLGLDSTVTKENMALHQLKCDIYPGLKKNNTHTLSFHNPPNLKQLFNNRKLNWRFTYVTFPDLCNRTNGTWKTH